MHQAARSWAAPAAVLVALAALWASLDFYRAVRAANQANPDPYRIEEQVARLAALKAALPHSEMVVGYLSDQRLEDVRGSAMFFGTLYALAPRLVVAEPSEAGPRLVIGNFAQPGDWGAAGREHKLRVRQDFGSGVVLFERETR